MNDDKHSLLFAGFDIGSISISAVVVNEKGHILHSDYHVHHGNITDSLRNILKSFLFSEFQGIGVNESGREFFRYGLEVNDQVALIEGVRKEFQEPGSIINIGGETFGLILFDDKGNYRKYISNSSCAAGTGSFLDQQASRLGLKDSSDLAELAARFEGEPPKIATRCAVFAKTDLIHAQQQGYSLPAIASGLCEGVVQNIADTLFHGVEVREPVILTGGVARNRKIVSIFSKFLGLQVTTPHYPERSAAYGAALCALEFARNSVPGATININRLLKQNSKKKSYFYSPLSEVKSGTASFPQKQIEYIDEVEIILPTMPEYGKELKCYLGIDIGSTSTKAVLTDQNGKVILGLYTRTMGQPVQAVQKLTGVLEKLEKRWGVTFRLTAVGTTGSGRKFIQRITGADYILDEITAHARAAYHLNPEIDTIIEIGGQDSKFTVMQDGNVTFSVMNYVCAAGTGSFIEEQANRLGVSLDEYSELALDCPAPLTSDRCTVFMERDLNQLLSLGYSRGELLAAALHSVRDNYLTKVAQLNKIGKHVAFQGATARNLALVRAFEQKLKRPIYVSEYCHLTGALGVCLKMLDELKTEKSQFRKNFHHFEIQVEEEVCEYCKNHCKIKKVEIEGEVIGWGYLCGRDESDEGYRKKIRKEFDLLWNHRRVFNLKSDDIAEKQTGIRLFRELRKGGVNSIIRKPYFSLKRLKNHLEFNLIELRRDLFSTGISERREYSSKMKNITIGIPLSFTLLEFFPFWNLFFRQLGFRVVASSSSRNYITDGKALRRSEFCVPITNFHGVIKALSEKADYIFFPHFFENSTDETRRAYCYYTNYTVPVIQNIPELNLSKRIISPVYDYSRDTNSIIRDVYLSFPEKLREKLSFSQVEEAYNLAGDWFDERQKDLKNIYLDRSSSLNDIAVVLLGRPYLILDRGMNKGIPDKLSEMGIQTFSMDMIPVENEKFTAAKDFLRLNHWNYGRTIIEAAEVVARSEKLFPIYLTAFKCSPDSFVISYFKDIMDYYKKPYLILQLDEHNTGEGYDTRLEAAIRTFRNYEVKAPEKQPPSVSLTRQWKDKVYLIPNYDPTSARLMQAAFLHNDVKAVLIEETSETISSSLRLNDGQCLPVSALAQAVAYTIQKQNLNPEKTALYMNSESNLNCNLPQYPLMLKKMLESINPVYKSVEMLIGKYSMTDLSFDLLLDIYHAYLFSSILQKMVCKIRPRELESGATDRVFDACLENLHKALLTGSSREKALKNAVNEFFKIPVKNVALPQIGIIGDLYVRDNHVINQGLIREIEKMGAEAVIIPFLDGVNLLTNKHFQSQKAEGEYLDFFRDKITLEALRLLTRKYTTIARPILGEQKAELEKEPLDYLKKFHLIHKHTGETVENLLKIYFLMESNPGIRLILHINPIFCCPGLVSEAIFKQVEKDIGIPIVSITYDGTQTNSNDILKPYLYYFSEIYEEITEKV